MNKSQEEQDKKIIGFCATAKEENLVMKIYFSRTSAKI
jgi:hypothetical protein